MGSYHYHSKNVRSYLKSIYDAGLEKSNYLTDIEVEELIANIGIFKFKGYYYAFKNNIADHSIDVVL